MKHEVVQRLAVSGTVARAVATFHVDASASDIVDGVFRNVENMETARSRDVAYFASACITAHYLNRARYSVLCRRAVAVAS
jgi:hypothetical protein